MNTLQQKYIHFGSVRWLFMFSLAVMVSMLLALSLPTGAVLAGPVAPGGVQLTQPDGTVIFVVPFGDESYSGYEYQGYTILLDSASGYWVYAESEQGGLLTPGKAKAGIDKLPLGLERNLRDEPALAAMAASALEAPSGAPWSGSSGSGKVLIILTDFTPSTSRGTTAAQWNAKFFDTTPGARSVKSWYEQASYGQFTLDPVEESYGAANDGVIEVTLPYANAYPWPDETERTSVRDTLLAADPYVDYAALDTDHNGSLDNTELHLVLIVRGFEESYGGTGGACGPNVWGHRWSMPTGTCANCAPVVDGVTVGASAYNGGYTREGEWHEYLTDGCDGGAPGHIATMGIMVHELGHDIDWPDTYDIDGSSAGVGNWDIMAGGSWGQAAGDLYSGETPVLPDPFLKWYQHWLTPVQVTAPSASIAIPNSAQNNTVYQLGINPNGIDWASGESSGMGEYFLVENRQQVGFDAGLRKISSNAKGCLIWHIDETRISSNSANADETRKLVDVEEADGAPQDMDSNANRGDSGDPWPGTTGETAFSASSDPNSNWYDGSTSGISLANISTAGTGCTLDFTDIGPTWTGSVSSGWNNPANWTTGRVPNQNDNVIIPSGVPNWPNVNAAASVYNLNILDGAHVDASADVSLEVYGSWIEQGSGYFSASAGTVVLRGSSAQMITSGADSHFYHLQIGDGSTSQTVTAGSDLDVNGNLDIQAGAKLAAGSYTLRVGGNWTDNPFGFDPGTGTVILDGTTQTIQRAATEAAVYSNDLSSTSGWQIYDANGNSSTWYFSTSTNGPNLPDHGGHYRYQQPLAGDDWAFSPGFTLQAGVTYNIHFNYASMGSSWREKLGVHIGNAQTVGAMTTQVFDNNNITNATWQPGNGVFTPATTGTYYVGFHVYSDPNQYKVGIDDLQVTASDPDLAFYNLSVANGSTTAFANNVAVQNDVTVNAGGTLTLGTYNLTVEGAVTNNGALAQTKAVNAASTSFLNLKNKSVTDKYWGVTIDPGSNNLGSTTVTIRGNQLCPSISDGVKRCFDLVPATPQAAAVTFYYTEAERNGAENPAMQVYHWSSATWEQEAGATTRGGSGDSQWVRAEGINAYSPFALNSISNHTVTFNSNSGTGTMTAQTANVPTALTLNAFTRTGYTFAGWNTAADGSGTNYADGANYSFAADITLYAQWTQNEYTLTVVSAHGTVTRDNNGPYHLNDVVTLTAVADEGWTFTGWTPALIDNKVTITGNTTVTANYSQDEYTLTVVSAHGTVTRDNNGPYHLNDVVTLTATADEGWTFTGWTPTLIDNKVTITGDTTVTTNYSQDEYTLTVISAHGTVTRNNNGPYHLNDVVTLTVVADEGWRFTGWTPALTGDKVTITGNTTVTANYSQDEYALAYSAGVGGTLTGNTSQTVAHGADGTAVTAVPNAGYHFVDWSDGSTANPRTDTNVMANVSVTAYFAVDTFTLNYAAGTGGTLTGTTLQTVNYGESGTAVTAVPTLGYHFINWSDGLTANPRTDINVTANLSVTANYAQDEYMLTVVSAHGTVTRDNNGPYHLNDVVTLTATADNGWTFTGWTPALVANKVTITGDTTVTANYSQNEYTLTVISAHGTVTRDNNGPYHLNDVVTLSVAVDTGWTFTGWTPTLTNNKVTITGNTTVTANYSQDEYTLTVISAHGTVTKGPDKPSYQYGEEVTLNVSADEGWTFTGWTPSLTDNKVTITGNTTVTANYSQDEYTLTVISAHGTVTRDNNGPYHLNDVVTLSAAADAGWTFTGWTPTLTNNKVTITGNTTVTANYSQDEYTLTVISAHGTVTRDNNGPYHLNDVVTLTVVADKGWTFTGWTPSLTDNKVTITGNTTITADFAQNEYTLTVVSGHGAVMKTPDKLSYQYGEEVTLSVTPDAGWTFTGWTPSLTDNKVTITGNTTVTANYSQDEYTLTVVSAHGTVTRDNDGPYHLNDVVTLTVAADEGWTFTGWTPSLTDNKITITGDTTVTANFTPNSYTLEVSVVGNGTVLKLPDQPNYTVDSEVQLTATAAPGWTFSGWSGDASGSTNPLNVTMDGNKSITATFIQNTYTLAVTVVGNGVVTRNNDGPYHLSDEVILTATPDLGWSFAEWGGDATGSANQFTITIDGDKSVTATFLQSEYTLNVLTSGNGTVTRDNNGPYHLNDQVTLTAIPDAGWTFSGWDGSGCSGTDVCVVTVDDHKTVTAVFLPIEYVLTVNTTGSGAVTRNPDRATYHYGEMVELTAVAGSDWTFDSWGDALSGNTNPQYVTINGDMTVSASFTQNSYTLDVSVVGNGTVSKSPDQPNYLSGSTVQLTATAESGWQFSGWSGDVSGNTNPLDVTMNSNKSITATFAVIPPTCYPLILNHTGQGSDPVASPANSAGCSAGQYLAGTSIDLSGAAPTTGWLISGWSGTDNDASTAGTNSVTMPASAHTASVSYTQIEYSLTITVAGSGSVAKSPNQTTYHYGNIVQLTATPVSGWTFTGWSGNLSGTTNPASLTINGNKSVTATFSQTPTSLAYGVHDEGTNNTQFFTINPQTLATTALGSLQKGYDIEALSAHPATGALYAASGADNTRNQRGYLFSVNKQTGALTAIGYTGYKSVPGISFRNDGTLWGWASGKGLIQINLTTGKSTVKYSSSLSVGDIAWNSSGTTLYIATTNGRLYSYSTTNNKLTLFADNLPSNVEALDIRSDGLLVMGIHSTTRIRAYDPIKKKFVDSQYIQTRYDDVEGIAWP